MSKSRLLYLHGFNSSPQSVKARTLGAWIEAHRPDIDFMVPALPFAPAQAIRQVVDEYFTDEQPLGILGSSLGGYYALYLHVRFGVPALLINPALKPFDLLDDYLGENQNLYTGERYQLESAHLQELHELWVQPVSPANEILGLVQTGDQTLDYRDALKTLARHKLWLMPGGSHDFEGFESVFQAILGHFNLLIRN